MDARKLFISLAFLCFGLTRADVIFVDYNEMSKKANEWAEDLLKDFETKQKDMVKELEEIKLKRDTVVKEAQEKSRITNEKGREDMRDRIIKLESELKSADQAAQYKLKRAADQLEAAMDKRVIEICANQPGTVLGIMPGGVVRALSVKNKDGITEGVLEELIKKHGHEEEKKK